MSAIVMLIAVVVAAAVVVGVVGLVVAAVAMTLKLLPILLIGYVAVKLIQRTERARGRGLTTRDGMWLDTRS